MLLLRLLCVKFILQDIKTFSHARLLSAVPEYGGCRCQARGDSEEVPRKPRLAVSAVLMALQQSDRDFRMQSEGHQGAVV